MALLLKKNILKSIWGYSEESETSTLEAHVFRLRNKLAILKITDFIITFESGYMVKKFFIKQGNFTRNHLYLLPK